MARREARPLVVSLADPLAVDVDLTGAKAANLARAATAGLPVLPGFVITTTAARLVADAGSLALIHGGALSAIRSAWESASEGGSVAVVARSSSPGEDGERSSMAGRFTSVLDIDGWDAFVAAVDEVVASARIVSLQDGSETDAGMAVLVQPHLAARAGGVLFGADPVTGRSDRLMVAAVAGGPDALVSGQADGTRYSLTRRGRVREVEGDRSDRLTPAELRHLAALARRTANVFGGPQDTEWAFDGAGGLLLLQSRPVTAISAIASGPLFGPGPVAETFPDSLTPLELDLWAGPLQAGLRHAIGLTGAVSRRRLSSSPVVIEVGGRVAVDLAVIGADPRRRPFLAKLDPRPPARRVRAAWRTGRLSVALPGLARDVLDRTDEELASVPPLTFVDDHRLVAVLRGGRQMLVALHGYEILVGLLLRPKTQAATAASEALRTLVSARAAGVDDEEIVPRYPIVLALVPPAVRPATLPPPHAALSVLPPTGEVDEFAELRELLRLRARFVQELTAKAAWEVGERLAHRGVIADAQAVRWLTGAELESMLVSGSPAPQDLGARQASQPAPPLPAVFRLTPAGDAVAVDAEAGDGHGAGGGRGTGVVAHVGDAVPAPGCVLVVRNLDPGLAAFLPGLGGLVAETGSVLSHLAILAREFGIPTVVGVHDAVDRFPAGATVVVDGSTGEVSVAEGTQR